MLSLQRELFEPLVLRDETINKKELFKNNALTMAAFTLPFFLMQVGCFFISEMLRINQFSTLSPFPKQHVPVLDALGFGLAQAAAAPLAAMMLNPGGVDAYTSVMKKDQ